MAGHKSSCSKSTQSEKDENDHEFSGGEIPSGRNRIDSDTSFIGDGEPSRNSNTVSITEYYSGLTSDDKQRRYIGCQSVISTPGILLQPSLLYLWAHTIP
jgi:hypothetical protein